MRAHITSPIRGEAFLYKEKKGAKYSHIDFFWERRKYSPTNISVTGNTGLENIMITTADGRGREDSSTASGLEELSVIGCFRKAGRGSGFGVQGHSFAELGPGKRTGAADEAADRESQMTPVSSRNPDLEQVLPEPSCPAPLPATWPRGLARLTNVLFSQKPESRGWQVTSFMGSAAVNHTKRI